MSYCQDIGDTPAALIVCPTLGRRHQHVTHCCRNIQPSFSKCLGIQKVCLGFKRIHRNVDKKYFKKSKNSEKNKIMICGIHYFITKLKTKIDVILGSRFNMFENVTAHCLFCYTSMSFATFSTRSNHQVMLLPSLSWKTSAILHVVKGKLGCYFIQNYQRNIYYGYYRLV